MMMMMMMMMMNYVMMISVAGSQNGHVCQCFAISTISHCSVRLGKYWDMATKMGSKRWEMIIQALGPSSFLGEFRQQHDRIMYTIKFYITSPTQHLCTKIGQMLANMPFNTLMVCTNSYTTTIRECLAGACTEHFCCRQRSDGWGPGAIWLELHKVGIKTCYGEHQNRWYHDGIMMVCLSSLPF